MKRLAPRIQIKEEKNLEIYGALREYIGIKTYLHGPVDYAKKLKLSFRVGTWTCQEEGHLPVVGRRRTWPRIYARVAPQGTLGLT